MVAESSSVMMFFLLYWLCALHVRSGQVVMAETTIKATAPMPEVKEGGILALHCSIKKFQRDYQKISISRNIRVPGQKSPLEDLLTLDGKVHTDKQGVFLAVRMLTESTVHFMTITGVTKEDEGRYVCKILDPGLHTITTSDVDIKILYFPKGPSPKCTPPGEQLYRVLEGDLVTLNCSSEKGYPKVEINWSRSGNEEVENFAEVDRPDSDVIYTITTFRPRLADDSVIFYCKVTSKMFPGQNQQCHIGPLKVIPNPSLPTDVTWPIQRIPATTPYYGPQPKPPGIKYNNTADECHEYCAEITQKSVANWTIATIVAGFLALFFFIFGIILLIKYCLATEPIPDTPTDDINHVNIHGMEYRLDGNRLYMTLERPGPSQTEAVYHGGEVIEREYLGTPIRDIEVIAIGAQGGPSHEGQISSPSDKGENENKLKTPTPEEAECTIAVSPSAELERKSSMGTPTKGESEKESDRESLGTPTGMLSVHGTPTKGESERLINGTPTLPPRRYRSKSHYV